MADLGTLPLIEPQAWMITDYRIGGLPSAPTVPTTGQIWPRGNW